MNTADRSVEALDTALRRRFEFEEVMPKPELLDEDFEFFNLKELLQTINQRIEILLDRDHTIGHSYFMKVYNENDLRNVFKNNIIPLLQEYFYGDYEKIGLILGNAFFEKETIKYTDATFANFKTQNKPEHGEILRLKPINKEFNIIDAINTLLNKDA